MIYGVMLWDCPFGYLDIVIFSREYFKLSDIFDRVSNRGESVWSIEIIRKM